MGSGASDASRPCCACQDEINHNDVVPESKATVAAVVVGVETEVPVQLMEKQPAAPQNAEPAVGEVDTLGPAERASPQPANREDDTSPTSPPSPEVLGSPERNVEEGTESDLAQAYLDKGYAQRDRRRLVFHLLFCLIVSAPVLYLIWNMLPELLGGVLDIGEEIRKNKDRLAVVVILVTISYSAAPIPGRAAWNLVVGYVYGWIGFPILFFGSAAGLILAFIFTRCACKRICCCVREKGNSTPKTLLFLISCVAVVEESPLYMVFLLMLSPVPQTATAYVLGIKAPSLPVWKFSVATTLAGVRFAVPIYVGEKAGEMAELIEMGVEQDPASLVLLIVSLLVLVIAFAFIGRLALKKIKQAQEALVARRSTTNGDRQNGVSSDQSVSKLSQEMYIEFQKSLQGEQTSASRPRVYYCCMLSGGFGCLIFVWALILMIKFTPLFDPIDVYMVDLTMCPRIEADGALLNITGLRISYPLRVVNPNLVEVSATLSGELYNAVSRDQIGTIHETQVSIPACKKQGSFRNSDPSEVVINADASVADVSGFGVPQNINLADFFPPGAQDANCTPPAQSPSGNATPSEQRTYVSCLRTRCQDADLVALGAQGNCQIGKMFLGCDADISKLGRRSMPNGTLLSLVCPKTCNTCERRLSSMAPQRHLQASPAMVISFSLKGSAGWKIFAMKRETEFNQQRARRRSLMFNATEFIRSRVEAVQNQSNSSSRNISALMAGVQSQCTSLRLDPGAYCADSIDQLFGEEVPDAAWRCDNMQVAPKNVDDMELKKSLLLGFLMALGLSCFGGCVCFTMPQYFSCRKR